VLAFAAAAFDRLLQRHAPEVGLARCNRRRQEHEHRGQPNEHPPRSLERRPRARPPGGHAGKATSNRHRNPPDAPSTCGPPSHGPRLQSLLIRRITLPLSSVTKRLMSSATTCVGLSKPWSSTVVGPPTRGTELTVPPCSS